MKFEVYTMGFSNRTWDETLEILANYKIKRVVDIRTLPGSKHTPQFNLENLQLLCWQHHRHRHNHDAQARAA